MLRRLVAVLALALMTTGLTAVIDATPAEAGSSCGSAYSSYKYSTKVLWWTVDVFRHSNRTYACENDTNIYSIWKGYNNCSKYGWGIMYWSSTSYSDGGEGTPIATSLATCAMSVGGTFHGIGLQYTKQSNTQHMFYINNGALWVSKSHWTTTP